MARVDIPSSGGLTKSGPRNPPIPAAKVHFPEEDLEQLGPQLLDILRSGRLTLGPYTEEFESAFARHHKRKFGIAVNSGTSALEIILRAMRIQNADVIVPANTFAATAFAAIHSGNKLVLSDVNRQLFADPDDVRSRIRPSTKAVVAVHIGGRVVPETDSLRRVCYEAGIPLLEDAAHAHGSRLGDIFAGGYGAASAFSFYPTKVMTSCEGGMILTDDPELESICRVYRDQGKASISQNLHTELGYNWRMSEIHACIGLAQLKRLAEFIEARRKIAAVYDKGLAGVPGLGLLRDANGMQSNYYKYIVMLPDRCQRATVKERLKQGYGISLSGEVYDTPLHCQPVFQGLARPSSKPFLVAEDVCKRHICLPISAVMTKDDAEYVVESIREVLA